MSSNSKTIIGGLKKYPVLVVSGMISVVLLTTLYFRSDLLAAQQIELDKNTVESNRHRANIVYASQLQEQLNFLMDANKAVKDRALLVGGLGQNLQYFYRLESEVGIKYIDLRPNARTPVVAQSAVYVPLNYTVNVQGDFLQIITFLKRLEQGAYFCRINSAVAASSGSSVTLNLNLDLLGVP